MQMRRRPAIGLALLAMFALVLWFEPTGVVRGWLRGESFFRSRPTNYWRTALLEAETISPFG
jgi:hypothetical protein